LTNKDESANIFIKILLDIFYLFIIIVFMDSIKSTKVSTKFGNTQKLKQLHSFIDEYRKIVSQFVNLLWKLEKVPVLLPKAITNQINSSWLTVRAIQCAGKQASAIVRGTRKKQQKRLYIYNKLNTEGHYKQARKLKAIINIHITINL